MLASRVFRPAPVLVVIGSLVPSWPQALFNGNINGLGIGVTSPTPNTRNILSIMNTSAVRAVNLGRQCRFANLRPVHICNTGTFPVSLGTAFLK